MILIVIVSYRCFASTGIPPWLLPGVHQVPGTQITDSTWRTFVGRRLHLHSLLRFLSQEKGELKMWKIISSAESTTKYLFWTTAIHWLVPFHSCHRVKSKFVLAAGDRRSKKRARRVSSGSNDESDDEQSTAMVECGTCPGPVNPPDSARSEIESLTLRNELVSVVRCVVLASGS